MSQSIKSKSRSVKLLFASLSLAASMSGWAWLTITQAAPQADVAPPQEKFPVLASLPVRGLRIIGASEAQSSGFNATQQPKPIRQAKGSH